MATGRRRGRAIIYIALILILLLVLVLVFFRFSGGGLVGGATPPATSQQTGPLPTPTKQSDVVSIVVNTQDVKRGQTLTDDLLALVPIPKADYTEGVFFTDKKEVVNGRAKIDLKAHTPLTNAVLLPVGATGSLPAFEIPAGKVAISVPISKLSSVAYGLQKGDHVNVIVSLLMVDLDTNFQSELPNRTGVMIAPGPIGENQSNVTSVINSSPEYTISAPAAASIMGRIEIDPTTSHPIWVLAGEKQRARLVSQSLIQDVVILQMGNFGQASEPAVPAAANPASTEQPQPTQQAAPAAAVQTGVPDVVTLIVSPQDAVTLNYLMLAGANLNMVMRSAGDTDNKATEAVTLQFILDQYRIPNPAKLPYGLQQRMDNFPNEIAPFPEPRQAATPTPVP